MTKIIMLANVPIAITYALAGSSTCATLGGIQQQPTLTLELIYLWMTRHGMLG